MCVPMPTYGDQCGLRGARPSTAQRLSHCIASLFYVGRNNGLGVLDFGRRSEIGSNQKAPFRETIRGAEREVVANCVPLGDQEIAVRLFY